MKAYIIFLVFTVFCVSCNTSKRYLDKANTENSLEELVEKLNKNPASERVQKAILLLYAEIEQNHLTKIKSYAVSKHTNRWGNIISEYTALQNSFYIINKSAAAKKIIKPLNYAFNLQETMAAAAEDYYQRAQSTIEKQGKENAKTAYNYFITADNYLPGYKDVKFRIEDAYERSVINVIIDPLADNGFLSKNGMDSNAYKFSDEYFQNKLLLDLQDATTVNDYPIKFYTKVDAEKNNLRKDWIVSLSFIKINDPKIHSLSSSFPLSTQSFADQGPVSKDLLLGYTAARPVYEVTGAIQTNASTFITIKANVKVYIKEVITGKSLSFKTINGKYGWSKSTEGYYGDSKAGIGKDLSLYAYSDDSEFQNLNSILEKLYLQIYPLIKTDIT